MKTTSGAVPPNVQFPLTSSPLAKASSAPVEITFLNPQADTFSKSLSTTAMPIDFSADSLDAAFHCPTPSSAKPSASVFKLLGTAGRTSSFSRTPEGVIAHVVKSSLDKKTDLEMHSLVKEHFEVLKLLKEDGTWAHPLLEEIGDKLLPDNLTVADFDEMTDAMAVNAAQNPYLHRFLEEAGKRELVNLYRTVRREGDQFFPEFGAYAMVLENLTKAMRENFHVAEACEAIWTQEREEVGGVRANIGFSGAVKYYSVEGPVSRWIDSLAEGEIAPDFLRLMLPINILEATAYDFYQGNSENAKAGWITAVHRPGGAQNALTGAGPTVITDDGNAISLAPPLPKQWADLYQTWNLGFVSQFCESPYGFVKLLIPQVSNYAATPGEYINNRALALYAHMNFLLFRRMHDGVGQPGRFDWSDIELTSLFGHVNAQSAQEYANEVDQLDPSRLARFKAAVSRIFARVVEVIERLWSRISGRALEQAPQPAGALEAGQQGAIEPTERLVIKPRL